MLNRRALRIKVMQALYGFFQSGNSDLSTAEKNVFQSLDRIYDLYLLQFLLLSEIHRSALREREEVKNKFFPDEEDLMETTPFTENVFLLAIPECHELNRLIKNRGLGWSKYPDVGDKLFRQLKQLPEYKKYIFTPNPDLKIQVDFIREMIKHLLWSEEYLNSIYEDENIHWSDDIDLVNLALIKTVEAFKPAKGIQLASLYKDEKDDREFVSVLFRKVILRNEELGNYITPNTENWESDRIAYMDLLLMKMAICELMEFPTIPVKVSMNEYIEISKLFSTPKSNTFVNGVLDKTAQDLKRLGLVKKTGRGLIENKL